VARSAKTIAQQKLRNRVARHPLLGKGGAHEKTRKAERRRDKQQLARERDEH
jgi:hypothetical protein